MQPVATYRRTLPAGVAPGAVDAVGRAWVATYRRLRDEDAATMVRRRALLDDAPLVDGVVTCPRRRWRFDVRTGADLAGGPGLDR
jgi:hypothetical protein